MNILGQTDVLKQEYVNRHRADLDLAARSAQIGSRRSKRASCCGPQSVDVFRVPRAAARRWLDRDLSASHARHGFGRIMGLRPSHSLMVATYLLIFGFVLGNRQSRPTGEFPGDFPGYILAGLVPWLMMQAALVRGPGSTDQQMRTSSNKSSFRLRVLPIASTIAATIPSPARA